MRGGGLRLAYSNPMHLDDVAIDFPDMQIVMAHPSFPWQDEALSLATHKPNVWIDLSGWSPKYFPKQLIQYANTLLKDRILFGSDYPLITPERWMKDFEVAGFRPEVVIHAAAYAAEVRWIRMLDCTTEGHGYNLTGGGEGLSDFAKTTLVPALAAEPNAEFDHATWIMSLGFIPDRRDVFGD